MITRRLPWSLSSRLYSSLQVKANLVTVQTPNDAIQLESNSSTQTIPLVWLRDHCKSPKSFNFSTNQRKSNLINIQQQSRVNNDSIIKVSNDKLIIDWIDGHSSEYQLDKLIDMMTIRKINKSEDPRKSWDKSSYKMNSLKLDSFEYKSFVDTFIKDGVVLIEGVERNAEETEKLCRKIGPIHDTFFGTFWTFSNEVEEDIESHEDTAYSNEEIGPHVDGTYLDQTPGIQVFHCLQPSSEGGETVLVDGLRCVEVLKEKDPKAYDTLCKTKIDHHYLEGSPTGSSLNSQNRQKTVIQLDQWGQFYQLRFNPYDRSTFRFVDNNLSPDDVINFYDAYSKLSQIAHDPSMAFQVLLQFGQVIFIDNFRVMHARTAFKGYRKMCGCYMSRDNFMAKARPFIDEKWRKFL